MSTTASNPVIEREVSSTSRFMEYFRDEELCTQIGQPMNLWPVALLKEMVDNSLDACEEANILPAVEVRVEGDAMSVQDNGPGLPAKTIVQSLDYNVRVSSKTYYVSPTRGHLGNALKCVWAAPFVVDGERGSLQVTSQGICHRIEVALDRIRQEPKLEHDPQPTVVKNGTFLRVAWPEIASYLKYPRGGCFYNAERLVRAFATFNPHADFVLRLLPGGRPLRLPATRPAWKKWMPYKPTSSHWYDVEALRGRIASCLTNDDNRDARMVRELVAEFAGLRGSGKQKRVLERAGLSKATLQSLVLDGDIDRRAVVRLLDAMNAESRIITPDALGSLGGDHLTASLVEHFGVAPESVRYKRVLSPAGDPMPFVLEAAFGVKGEAGDSAILAGLNWSPALQVPFLDLQDLTGEMRIDEGDPVVLLVHLVCPRPRYMNHGKGMVDLPPEIQVALDACVRSVARGWKKAKRQADHHDRVQQQDLERLRKANAERPVKIKHAAYAVMVDAFMKTSDGGDNPANARQIMYVARPWVIERAGKCWKKSSYFTQDLLIDFMDENPELTKSWDVVFDARGHLTEPHTGTGLGIGTLQVRRYVENWRDDFGGPLEELPVPHGCPTFGPRNRYRFALFVEKEGFDPLLRKAKIAERFDIAVMSTKGMTVTALRRLVERLTEEGVTILVLRDFDKAGFSIVHTMSHNTRRYKFRTRPRVIDLGLRLEDVRAMNLDTEHVEYRGDKDPRENLAECGATKEECDFLVRGRNEAGNWWGERVEMNAMICSLFISFLERKLVAHGVTKVVPDQDTLEVAYRRQKRLAHALEAANQILQSSPEDTEPVPADLAETIKTRICGTDQAWDEELWRIVNGES